jgi:DNA-directed RNA polymerase specialized sigma subunit
MIVTIRKAKKTSMQHPLGADPLIPKGIKDDRLIYLTDRIRAGEITADENEELSRGFIRLALSMAAQYAARNPSNAEDYAAVALFGVAYALSTAREKLYDDNLTGWVIANIKRRLRREREMNHIIRVPSTTFHAAKSKGRHLGHLSVYVVDSRELSAGEGVKTSMYFHRVRVRTTTARMGELKELLAKAAEDDLDRMILDMRSQGYNDHEISEFAGVSTSYVQRKRAALEARFKELDCE